MHSTLMQAKAGGGGGVKKDVDSSIHVAIEDLHFHMRKCKEEGDALRKQKDQLLQMLENKNVTARQLQHIVGQLERVNADLQDKLRSLAEENDRLRRENLQRCQQQRRDHQHQQQQQQQRLLIRAGLTGLQQQPAVGGIGSSHVSTGAFSARRPFRHQVDTLGSESWEDLSMKLLEQIEHNMNDLQDFGEKPRSVGGESSSPLATTALGFNGITTSNGSSVTSSEEPPVVATGVHGNNRTVSINTPIAQQVSVSTARTSAGMANCITTTLTLPTSATITGASVSRLAVVSGLADDTAPRAQMSRNSVAVSNATGASLQTTQPAAIANDAQHASGRPPQCTSTSVTPASDGDHDIALTIVAKMRVQLGAIRDRLLLQKTLLQNAARIQHGCPSSISKPHMQQQLLVQQQEGTAAGVLQDLIEEPKDTPGSTNRAQQSHQQHVSRLSDDSFRVFFTQQLSSPRRAALGGNLLPESTALATAAVAGVTGSAGGTMAGGKQCLMCEDVFPPGVSQSEYEQHVISHLKSHPTVSAASGPLGNTPASAAGASHPTSALAHHRF